MKNGKGSKERWLLWREQSRQRGNFGVDGYRSIGVRSTESDSASPDLTICKPFSPSSLGVQSPPIFHLRERVCNPFFP